MPPRFTGPGGLRPRLDGEKKTNGPAFRWWLGLALITALGLSCQHPVALSGTRLLSSALAARRPGAARLIGAPRLEPRSPVARVVWAALRAAEIEAEARPNAASLHDAARAALLAGRVDRALPHLESALERSPEDAAIWSDLAAAHIQRFEATAEPEELILALAAADRALALAPSCLAARFNLALALERLALGGQAAEEWRLAVAEETDSLWRGEAQAHLEAARRTAAGRGKIDLAAAEAALAAHRTGELRLLVARSHGDLRLLVEEELLPRWAAAEIRGEPGDARKSLSSAREVSDALLAVGSDPMAADAVRQIERLRAPERLRLASGLAAYRRALHLIQAGRFATALAVLRRCEWRLRELRCPFAYRVAYDIASCGYQVLAYRRVNAELARLLRDPALRRYGVLRGRSLLLAGLIDSIEGRHAASVAAHQQALAIFRGLRESALAVRAGVLLAGDLDILGQRAAAWQAVYATLGEAAFRDVPEVRRMAYGMASLLTQERGETAIALRFQTEAVSAALGTGQPYLYVGALRGRASLLALLGRRQDARRDLDLAWSFWRRVPDVSTRLVLEGDLRLADGELMSVSSPSRAIVAFDRAVELFRSSAYHYRLGQALFERALAERSLGMTGAVERDLSAALAESERQRTTIAEAADRVTYFDRTHEVFEEMIALQLGRVGGPEAALLTSERSKARSLWDWIVAGPAGSAGAVPLPPAWSSPELAAFKQGLPEGMVAIEYATMRDRTAVWVLRRRGPIGSAVMPVGSETLGELVRRLRQALERRLAAPRAEVSERLYETLIRPIGHLLRAGDRLALVPDGVLHLLPFALLRERTSGRVLAQDHVLSVSPSLHVLAACVLRGRRPGGSLPARALVVADPSFDRELHPELPALTAAEDAAAIVRLFPGSRLLRQAGATRSAFLGTAGDFEIVHFAGHSIVDLLSPLSSHLVLSADPSDPSRGALYASEILRARFARTRLVVLASCSTGAGKLSPTEGVESLALPFLAAGVPTVVASLWRSDDSLTAEFFSRFYRHLRQGLDVAAALQATQMESLELGRQRGAPEAWAGFEVIGDGASGSWGQPAAPPLC